MGWTTRVRAACVGAVWIVGVATALPAQGAPGASATIAATRIGVHAITNATDPALRGRDTIAAPVVRKDRYPAKLLLSDRAYGITAGAALGFGFLVDHSARAAIRGYRTPFLTSIAPLGNVFGTASYTVPITFTALVAAHLSHNANWQDATRHVVLSYLLADLTTSVLKGSIGRQRPHYSANPWDLHPFGGITRGEFQSFPSGHVTHITSIAAAVAQEALCVLAILSHSFSKFCRT